MKKRVLFFSTFAAILGAWLLPATVHAQNTYTISGTVKCNGAAKEGVAVSLYNDTQSNRLGPSTSSKSDGSYEFSGQASGTYYIRVDGGYAIQEGSDDSGYVEVTVANQNTTKDIDVIEVVTITGSVTDNDGNGISGMKLELYRGDRLVNSEGATTGYGGSYTFYVKKDDPSASGGGTTETIKVVAKKQTIDDKTYPETTICTINGISSNQENQDCTLTAAAVTEYDLWINGVQVTSGNQKDVLGDGGSVVFEPYSDSGYFEPILVLTNANLNVVSNNKGGSSAGGVIESYIVGSSLIMVFVGSNTITVPQQTTTTTTGSAIAPAGILAEDLDISGWKWGGDGGGSLAINNPNSMGSGIEVEELNVHDGATLDITAGEGITSSNEVTIDGIADIDIDAQICGISAINDINVSSAFLNIESDGDGVSAQNVTIDASNVTISAPGTAMQSPLVAVGSKSAAITDFDKVDVVAGTDPAGANAATYVDANQLSYKYIKTKAIYTKEVSIPLTLDIANANGSIIPATNISFAVESFVNSMSPFYYYGDAEKILLQLLLDKFAEIGIGSINVTSAGVVSGNYVNIKLTEEAARMIASYGLKVGLDASALPDGWTAGGEEYQIAFDYDSSGNLIASEYYLIKNGAAVGDPLAAATFTVTYNGGGDEATVKAYRQVKISAADGVTTNPGAGTYYVAGSQDFTFTAVFADGEVQKVFAKGYYSEKTVELEAKRIDRYTYQYTLHKVTEPWTITFGSASNAGETGTEAVAETKIWAHGGSLHISAASDTEAAVYSITGALVKTFRLTAGEAAEPLERGVYIVKAGGKTEKVVIR